MLSLRAVFVRYCSIHRHIKFRPRNIGGRRLSASGRVERITVSGNHFTVEGWSTCKSITIRHGDQALILEPSLHRADVKAEFPGSGNLGFAATMPFRRSPILITAKMDERQIDIRFGQFMKLRTAIENTRLAIRFSRDGLRALPTFIRWLKAGAASQKFEEKQRIKAILGLNPKDYNNRPIIAPNVYLTPQPISIKPQKITIVLPVFNAFEVLQSCLTRVFEHTDVEWHLVLIEDCSTDPRIMSYLDALAAGPYKGSISLLKNPQNIGFIGSVNRGLEVAIARAVPVVLLNSDALVPRKWASRLIAPLNASAVASVTPMSNDAEIVSAPFITTSITIGESVIDKMDATAQSLLSGVSPVEIPTGVGFCMAIAPEWLLQVPQLDTTFGRGYGEEVDWCRKIKARGGKHVAQPSLYVEHRGGQSFGQESKLERLSANNKIVSMRYPEFDAEVQEFIRTDPLISARMVLALAWAAAHQEQPITVMLVHAMGGGADHASTRQIGHLVEEGQAVVVLRFGGRKRFELSLVSQNGTIRAATNEIENLDHVFDALAACRFVYACGVGDSDPVFIPRWLVKRINKNAKATVEIQFHDFFPISPSYNLLDQNGMYRGVPIGARNTDPEHVFVRPDNTAISLSEWQKAWGVAIECASVIEVYSKSSAEIVTAIWPSCAARLHIKAHDALFVVPQVKREPNILPKVIGVLGNIGYQKGAQVVADLAAYQKRAKQARIVIIGNIDPQFKLTRSVTIHGSYTREDIAQLAESYGIDCWFIPSIWPETFSFATHEVLATKLPVWCFDLGAQADAVRDACQKGALGGVIPVGFADSDSAGISRIILHSKSS